MRSRSFAIRASSIISQLLRSHTQALTSLPMFIAETEVYFTPFA